MERQKLAQASGLSTLLLVPVGVRLGGGKQEKPGLVLK